MSRVQGMLGEKLRKRLGGTESLYGLRIENRVIGSVDMLSIALDDNIATIDVAVGGVGWVYIVNASPDLYIIKAMEWVLTQAGNTAAKLSVMDDEGHEVEVFYWTAVIKSVAMASASLTPFNEFIKDLRIPSGWSIGINIAAFGGGADTLSATLMYQGYDG